MSKKINMDWSTFDQSVELIVKEYKNKGITKIIGISRGGLPLAVALSNELNIPMVPVTWQTRSGSVKDLAKLKEETEEPDQNILFVDDICDSGLTIKQISEYVAKARWVTLITKQKDIVEFAPINMIDNPTWVIFPWEKK